MNRRKEALEVLKKVFNNGAYANLSLRNLDYAKEDINAITNLVYGTIRNNIYLKYQYQEFVKKALNTNDEIILMMAIFELEFLHKEAYATVNEYVNLARFKNVVNGVLRNYLRRPILEIDESTIEGISIRYSIDKWILQMMKAHYGFETMVKTAQAMNQESKLYYRLNTLKADASNIKECYDVEFIDDYTFTSEINLVKSEEFRKGLILVQDYSSQQVVKFLELREDMEVLDVCAAPGTKTSQIAMIMNNTGFIVANDIYDKRVKLIDSLADKLAIENLQTINQDASDLQLDRKFDRILCDVVCSGLGTLSSKPEIKLHTRPNDLDEIIKIQAKILESSSNYLKTDGIMVYSTCTLNKKENEKQVVNFLKNHENFELVEERTIFPYEYNSDGFYMAKIRKVK